MKNLKILLFLLAVNTSFAGENYILKAERLVQFKQEVLDWHIRWKTDRGAKGRTERKDIDLCFIYTKEKNESDSLLKLYNLPCPSDQTSNQAFIDLANKQKPLNTFKVSALLKSNAENDFSDLTSRYDEKITSAESSLTKLKEEVKKDTLGRLIFMDFNGKKINVGYMNGDNKVMDLCSGAWRNLCIFEYKNKSSTLKFSGKKDSKNFQAIGFKLGYESYDHDAQRDHEKIYNKWELPRKTLDFVELISANLFTRGNDDSRPQGMYYFNSPILGKKIPISEDWFRYLSHFDETKGLVEKAKNENGQHIKTKRGRSEWNYLTAIHPVHIIKVKDSKTSEESIKVFMGASVIFDESLTIDEAECDMSEAEGFLFKSLDDVNKTSSTSPYLSPIQLDLLTSSVAEVYSENEIMFNKDNKAQLINKMHLKMIGDDVRSRYASENPEFVNFVENEYTKEKQANSNQFQFFPELVNPENISIFSLTSMIPIEEIKNDSMWAVIKPDQNLFSSYMYEDDNEGVFYKELAEKNRKIYGFNHLKEFLQIQKNGQDITVNLYGFNPNEYITNNTQKITYNGLNLFVDPLAVYKVWTQKSDLSEEFGSTHLSSRNLGKELKDTLDKLTIASYKAQEKSSIQANMKSIAKAIKDNQYIEERLMDVYLRSLTKNYRMTGKNLSTPYASKGRIHNVLELKRVSEYKLISEMSDENWKFPTVLYRSEWKDNKAVNTIVPFTQGEQSYLKRNLPKFKTKIDTYISDKIHAQVLNLLLEDEKGLEKLFDEIDTENLLSKKINEDNSYFQVYDSYLDYLRSAKEFNDNQVALFNHRVRIQLTPGGKLSPWVNQYFEFLWRDMKIFKKEALFQDINSCYEKFTLDSDLLEFDQCQGKFKKVLSVLGDIASEIRWQR